MKIKEATEFLSEFLKHHHLNATSRSPQAYSRFVWLTGDDNSRNRVILNLVPRTHGGPSVLDHVADIGHIRDLVWLEMLDLTALPASTNFYMATMVRIEDAVRRVAGTASRYARHDLQKLQNAKHSMGIGWPGNIRESAGQMDADTYAVEVQRNARAQVMGPSDVAEGIEEAAEFLNDASRINPLFVFPIMNLEFGFHWLKEILPASKVLRSPRLVFVLTSDDDVVRAASVLGKVDVDRFIPRTQIINVESQA